MRISQYIESIKTRESLSEAFVYHRYLQPQKAVYGNLPQFHHPIQSALRTSSIKGLYRHQVEAIDHVRSGQHILVATPTASGKSLIYNLPVIERMLENPQARALYIFPLKALEQDQLKTLSGWIDRVGARTITARIYDGDTPPYQRKKIRAHNPNILFTNPDMLHRGILAYHEQLGNLPRKPCFRGFG
ncbi:MAG: DEAD/DEAH box helicase [Deltaproteobacteria bacterium]|nr:DEAD/DEAH box helicase [Deltaproteobacteria bacterium]